MTLAAFTTAWISSTLAASDRKTTTKAMYAAIANKHIVGAPIGPTPLDKLKPSHVEAWTVELPEARTIGVDHPLGVHDPPGDSGHGRPRRGAGEESGGGGDSPEGDAEGGATPEHGAGQDAAREGRASRYALLFELLVNTGLRRGEALALTRSDVDLEEAIRSGEPSLGRRRRWS